MTPSIYLLAFHLLLASTSSPAVDDGRKGKKVLLCYLAEWSVGRTGPGKFYAEYLDPHLCDILVYAFVGLDPSSNRITSISPNTDNKLHGIGFISEVMALKKENPNLKIMVSCGGWDEGSVKFSNMADSPEARRTFIESVVEYLKKHRFDGFDVAWLYPTDRGGISEDKENFVALLQELREELNRYGFLLTAQLVGEKYLVDPGYDLPKISDAVDYINLMANDYHYPDEKKTGHNAPLRSKDGANVEFSVNYFLEKGVPPEKILLAFSTFGYQFLMDIAVTDEKYLGVPASRGLPGAWSVEDGYIGFNEICHELTSTDELIEFWDVDALARFAVKGNKFVSYDDRRSYREKLKFLEEKHLGGAMVWTIDSDDFKGDCYEIKYPLVGEVNKYFRRLLRSEGTEDKKHSHSFNSTVINEEYFI